MDDWFRPRPYQHFDAQLSRTRAMALVSDPQRVVSHAFLPFLQREVSTPRYKPEDNKVVKKVRLIAYASHADSAIYSFYSHVISKHYEQSLRDRGLGEIPIAYRRFDSRPCNIDFATAAFQFITASRPCIALAFDIKGFFDTLDHSLLLSAWRTVIAAPLPPDHLKVFRSLTRYAFASEVEVYKTLGQSKKHRTENPTPLCSPAEFRARIRHNDLIKVNQSRKGIPQGSPVSAVLSNIYMLPFDLALRDITATCGGFARRYSDDILVVVPADAAEFAESAVEAAVRERLLALQPDKTDRVLFPATPIRVETPIQYLGFCFDGERILLRPQTLSRYYRRVRAYLGRAAERAASNPSNRTVYKRTLKRRFTHKGSSNFISYAQRSIRITQSTGIRKQIARHSRLIERWAIERTERAMPDEPNG